MNVFRELDRVLRGDSSSDPTATPKVRSLVVVSLLLAIGYGCCMGSFGLFGRAEPEFWQVVASGIKVPALFVLTLAATFPSLYVFNTILGSKLPFGELVRLLTSAMSVLIAVLASLGPIVAFFSATTVNYSFILLLNVVVFTVSGAFGLSFLIRKLAGGSPPEPIVADPDSDSNEEPARVLALKTPLKSCPSIGAVFWIWLSVFALVGTQMAWVLRPFVGSPFLPFTWFRPREASFFEAVLKSLRHLMGL